MLFEDENEDSAFFNCESTQKD